MVLKCLALIYPFLFAVYPVIFLFVHNIDEVSTEDIWIPLSGALFLTLIAFLLLRLYVKDSHKAAIITVFFLILFFSYGYIRDAFYSLNIGRLISANLVGPITNGFLGLLWIITMITGAFFMRKTQKNIRVLSRYFNIVAVILIVIPLVNMGIYEFKIADNREQQANDGSYVIPVAELDSVPDIYYIILDSYSRADVLEEQYQFDNSDFIGYLQERGFFIAKKSYSNYPITKLSLSSSLNMRYIHDIVNTVDTEKEYKRILYRMLQNNEVSKILKSADYRFIYISSGWLESDINRWRKYATVYRSISTIRMSEFGKHIIRSTALAPFIFTFMGDNSRNKVIYAFDTLSDMPQLEGPKFVFAHIIIPHSPFLFDKDGNTPQGKGSYIDQLIFTNKKVRETVDGILKKSDTHPIIIIQGDHGILVSGKPPLEIINAYLFPGNDYSLLYDSITPVNTFRVVLNECFGASFELLEDEGYHVKVNVFPYIFTPELSKN